MCRSQSYKEVCINNLVVVIVIVVVNVGNVFLVDLNLCAWCGTLASSGKICVQAAD